MPAMNIEIYFEVTVGRERAFRRALQDKKGNSIKIPVNVTTSTVRCFILHPIQSNLPTHHLIAPQCSSVFDELFQKKNYYISKCI